MNPEIEAVRELEDPLKQAQQASELLTRYQAAVTKLSRVRREAIEQLIAQGMTKAQLADHLGMTRARVGQLLAAGPRSEGLFFGNGKLTVWISTQTAFMVRGILAEVLGVPLSNVRVLVDHMGGGFGAKQKLTPETAAAINLARAAGAPVRVALERGEEMSVAGYRPGADIELALLASRSAGPSPSRRASAARRSTRFWPSRSWSTPCSTARPSGSTARSGWPRAELLLIAS